MPRSLNLFVLCSMIEKKYGAESELFAVDAIFPGRFAFNWSALGEEVKILRVTVLQKRKVNSMATILIVTMLMLINTNAYSLR